MNEGKLTEAERKKILASLKEAQAALDLSDEKMGLIIGCSRGLYNRLKRGEYGGDVDKYLRIARVWLEGRAIKVELPDAEYAPTSIGEQIVTVCDMAVEQPCIGIVKTPSGCGKTAALTEVARRLGGARCCYLQAGEAMAYKRELMYEIAERIGVAVGGSSHSIYRKIRARLAGYYSGGKGESYLIVIDEATTLQASAINLLRNLHDEPACRAAIVLADTIARLDGLLYAGDRRGIAGGNEQLRRRAKAQLVWPVDRTIPTKDVRAVADVTLRSLGHSVRLDGRAYQYLTRIAQDPGALRNVTARLQNVHYITTRRGLRADYGVAQLDFVGQLSGEACRMEHEDPPFAKAI